MKSNLNTLTIDELKAILHTVPANIFFKDVEGKYRLTSHICSMINTGDASKTILGKTDLEIQPDPILGKKFYKEDLWIVETGNSLTYLQPMCFGDQTYYYNISKQPVMNEANQCIGVVGIVNDITEQIKLQKEIEQRSITDALTKAYNRSYLDTFTTDISDQDYPLSIIVADINGLKKVNDCDGHHIGDMLIIKTYESMKTTLPKTTTIIRMGGDEFVALLPNCSASTLNSYLLDLKTNELKQNISASYGTITLNENNFPIAKAIQEADQKMYVDKQRMYSINK
ncbi:MAG: diguanylate cyclase domain-containing protein [Erysipelotrichaceae bacterium]